MKDTIDPYKLATVINRMLKNANDLKSIRNATMISILSEGTLRPVHLEAMQFENLRVSASLVDITIPNYGWYAFNGISNTFVKSWAGAHKKTKGPLFPQFKNNQAREGVLSSIGITRVLQQVAKDMGVQHPVNGNTFRTDRILRMIHTKTDPDIIAEAFCINARQGLHYYRKLYDDRIESQRR